MAKRRSVWRDVRERLVPNSVWGITAVIVAFAVGSAFSGVVFYSYYEFRKDKAEERMDRFVGNFGRNFDNALKTITAESEAAKDEIEKELEPLRRIRAEGETLEALVKKVKDSVFFVQTLDEAGAPSVGSAFSVASDDEKTLLLTSFRTVRAATHAPAPAVMLRQGDQQLKASLWTWQEDKDLALLILDKGSVPRIPFASGSPPLKTGERLFAVSGLGAAGGGISQGFVADVSAPAIQHDAAVGTAFQGGPLLNSDGEVLGVASRTYAPFNFQSDGVYFGVPIRVACEKVLKCPSGTEVSGAGAKR